MPATKSAESGASSRRKGRDRRRKDIELVLSARERRQSVERRLPIVEESVSLSEWFRCMTIYLARKNKRTQAASNRDAVQTVTKVTDKATPSLRAGQRSG